MKADHVGRFERATQALAGVLDTVRSQGHRTHPQGDYRDVIKNLWGVDALQTS
jgi:hypothetical protein